MIWYVFDCTKTEGAAFKCRSEWLADKVASLLTRLTGRTHDYSYRC